MKGHFAFLTSVLLLFFLFVVVSCSEAANLKKGIIGKWFKGHRQIEFLKDGTVIWGSNGGDYKFIDNNRMRIDIKGRAAMIFEVSIDKGQLILTADGDIERYISKSEMEKRIKEKYTFADLTVFDIKTKLMWIKDANIGGEGKRWRDALKFIENLNEKKYAGYSDWRLPSKEDLLTLVNFAKEQGYDANINEFFNKIGFKNVQAVNYWSATTNADIVFMGTGLVDAAIGPFYFDVWPVRGGQ